MKACKMLSCFILSLTCFMCFAGLTFYISPTAASVWQLDADSNFPTAGYGDFWLTFYDGDNDDIVDFGDILDFSGVIIGKDFPENYYPYTSVLQIPTPTITMPAIDGGVVTIPNIYGGLSTIWTFDRPYPDDTDNFGPDLWNYTATQVVPLPGAVLLLGSGLIGIVGMRRKFKK